MKRRQFLRSTLAAAGLVTGFPAITRAQNLNSRLHIASIGTGGRAAANIDGVTSENIIALADVDASTLHTAATKYKAEKTYADFRDLLDHEAHRLDAVLVGTPDHTHAPAAALALRLKKHVYCEKPLTHTVLECRLLQKLAQQNNCVTQMGIQIHAGDNYRRVVEIIQSGQIGDVRRVHVWMNASDIYSGKRFQVSGRVPENLNWDLWLGPAPWREYSEGVHPFTWRGFYEYGNGRLGDFGCHYMDLVHWSLGLKHPNRVHGRGPERDEVSTPEWMEVDYDYPSRGELPAVHVTWYGNRRPVELGNLRGPDGKGIDWGGGQLFIGSRGMVVSNYGSHYVYGMDGKLTDERPEVTIPRSMGHHAEWLHAIRNGGETTCQFDYSGPLTEAVLLGSVSYRSGEILQYDGVNGVITNSEKAHDYLHKPYRRGWVL